VTTTDEGASGLDAYKLGRAYAAMPIPMVPEACTDVPAGPVTFVVEGRRLTDEVILDNAREQGALEAIERPAGVDDGGTTIHVLGSADGLEHLRFDCFEHEPHYHYIDNAAQANVVVRIDTFAEGDPTAWSLRCLRERLPEMLGHAGVPSLAEQVRAARHEVAVGVDRVQAMVVRAP
jgi:hypothetical protein